MKTLILKKLGLITLIFTLSIASISNPYIELSSILAECCCESNCDCEHSKTTKTIIRNIQCGDSTSASIALFSFDKLTTNQLIQIKHNVYLSKNTIINMGQNNNYNNEPLPPPPRLFNT